MKITILYNNISDKPGFKSDWGFGAYIELDEFNIIFDTGQKPNIYNYNLKLADKDPKDAEFLFISHSDYDHAGGFPVITKRGFDRQVYVVESFRDKFLDRFKKISPDKVFGISDIKEIRPGIFSTGEGGKSKREHSLVINSNAGAVVITGCAHQGITQIVRTVEAHINSKIKLLLGGFHLKDCNQTNLIEVVTELYNSNIDLIAPSHCTGEKAIEMIMKLFKERFIFTGVGSEIVI